MYRSKTSNNNLRKCSTTISSKANYQMIDNYIPTKKPTTKSTKEERVVSDKYRIEVVTTEDLRKEEIRKYNKMIK